MYIDLKGFVEFFFYLWLIYLFGNLFFDRQRKHRVAEIANPVMEAIERKRICRALGMPQGVD